jgi:Flp pilus assembly protein TadG
MQTLGRRAVRDDRGANLVEFALLSIPFLMIVFGVIDFGRVIFAYSALAHGTREAVRVATVSGSHSSSPITDVQIQDLVRARAVGLTSSGVTVTTTWLPNNDPGSRVRLVSTYTFQPVTTVAFGLPFSLTSRTEQTITH